MKKVKYKWKVWELNVKVDVVSDRAIRKELKDEILKEAISIWKEITLFSYKFYKLEKIND